MTGLINNVLTGFAIRAREKNDRQRIECSSRIILPGTQWHCVPVSDGLMLVPLVEGESVRAQNHQGRTRITIPRELARAWDIASGRIAYERVDKGYLLKCGSPPEDLRGKRFPGDGAANAPIAVDSETCRLRKRIGKRDTILSIGFRTADMPHENVTIQVHGRQLILAGGELGRPIHRRGKSAAPTLTIPKGIRELPAFAGVVEGVNVLKLAALGNVVVIELPVVEE